MKRILFFVPILLIIAIDAYIALTHSNKTLSTKVQIIAGENFYADIASQIGGMYITTKSILADPNVDPHSYEPTSADALAVANGNIIIKNGLGYDTFVDKILATDQKHPLVITAADYATVIDDNPHVWYQLNTIERIANKIETDLQIEDSSHSAYYALNYQKFMESLSAIQTECILIKDVYSGHSVIATERVANYLLQDCGLVTIKNGVQKAVEEGTDPSVSDINTFVQVLNTHVAEELIYNKQTVSNITDRIKQTAQNDHIPVIGVTETMPIGSHYQPWMVNELKDIYNGFKYPSL